MGLLTFSINVTLDGWVDHQEGIADYETHAFFTSLMDEGGAMLWGRVTYEMMESYWPAVARGDEEAPPAMREWAVKLEAKPKYVVSSTRKDFPWTNSHHIAGDLRTGVQKLKDATPAGVLLGSGKRDRAGPAGSDRRVQVPRPPQDRRPWPDPVPERAAQHATPRAGLGEAAPQRRGRHALPARALTPSSPIAPSSLASASSGEFSPRNTAYPLHEPRLEHDRLSGAGSRGWRMQLRGRSMWPPGVRAERTALQIPPRFRRSSNLLNGHFSGAIGSCGLKEVRAFRLRRMDEPVANSLTPSQPIYTSHNVTTCFDVSCRSGRLVPMALLRSRRVTSMEAEYQRQLKAGAPPAR